MLQLSRIRRVEGNLYPPAIHSYWLSEMDFATGVDIYDIHGRLVRKGATSLDGLKRGVYIINQRKVIVS